MNVDAAARAQRHPLVAKLPSWTQTGVRDVVVRSRHRGLRSADLMTVAYPKSGSTWLRFLLTTALTGEAVGFDRAGELAPAIGRHRDAPTLLIGGGRLIHSHERRRSVVPGQRPRIVYLVRDARDVAISYYHHMQRWGAAGLALDDYIPAFLDSGAASFGTWQGHVISWLTLVQANPATMMVIRYEEMLADPAATVTAVSEHFGWGLSPGSVARAVTSNTPQAMREREAASKVLADAPSPVPFVRSASSGNWRNLLSATSLRLFDQLAGKALTSAGYPLAAEDAGRSPS